MKYSFSGEVVAVVVRNEKMNVSLWEGTICKGNAVSFDDVEDSQVIPFYHAFFVTRQVKEHFFFWVVRENEKLLFGGMIHASCL